MALTTSIRILAVVGSILFSAQAIAQTKSNGAKNNKGAKASTATPTDSDPTLEDEPSAADTAPVKPSKPRGRAIAPYLGRYLDLAPLAYKRSAKRTKFKSSAGASVTNKSLSTHLGFNDTDPLRFHFYGEKVVLHLDFGVGHDFMAMLGYRWSPLLDFGLDLDYSTQEAKTQTVNAGARQTLVSDASKTKFGLYAANVYPWSDSAVRAWMGMGLTSGETKTDDVRKSDVDGMYFKLGAEYAGKLNALGPSILHVSTLEYEYSTETEEKPSTFNPPTGEAKLVTHRWSLTPFGLRLIF